MIAARLFQLVCLLALATVPGAAGINANPGGPLEASADLSVTVASARSWTGSQCELIFDVTVDNRGPAVAAGVVLEAVVDPGSVAGISRRLMSAGPGVACDTETLTCLLGELGVAETATLSTLLQVSTEFEPTEIGLEFRVSSSVNDPQPSDNNFFSSAYIEAREAGGSGPAGVLSLAALAFWASRRRSRNRA